MNSLVRNQFGIAHFLLPMVVVITAALGGVYFMVASHADSNDPFIDISSPQCNDLKQIPHQDRGVVGINGTELAFAKNPCLRRETRKFDSYSLYVGTNYPSAHCPSSMTPRQCGKKAGKYNVKLARSLSFGKWWIDVEKGDGITWSPNQQDNVEFLQGMIDAMDNSTHPVGFYTTPEHWRSIVGDAGFQREMWYATGQHSADAARRYCNKSIGHNHTFMVQYVISQYGLAELDKSVHC
ncbi:MAG: hypothetical protein QFB86_02270 [Patescibacteria group bacterium]|nr:hypothetical protein [Patescibacteria group bacterium]